MGHMETMRAMIARTMMNSELQRCNTHMYMTVYICMYVYIYVYITYMHICIYVRLYIYLYICMYNVYIYIYTHMYIVCLWPQSLNAKPNWGGGGGVSTRESGTRGAEGGFRTHLGSVQLEQAKQVPKGLNPEP